MKDYLLIVSFICSSRTLFGQRFWKFRDIPFMPLTEGNSSLVVMWNSPPAADPKPREIETTQWESDEGTDNWIWMLVKLCCYLIGIVHSWISFMTHDGSRRRTSRSNRHVLSILLKRWQFSYLLAWFSAHPRRFPIPLSTADMISAKFPFITCGTLRFSFSRRKHR